jgi:tRNA U55 pseudouridine synthase TruB
MAKEGTMRFHGQVSSKSFGRDKQYHAIMMFSHHTDTMDMDGLKSHRNVRKGRSE